MRRILTLLSHVRRPVVLVEVVLLIIVVRMTRRARHGRRRVDKELAVQVGDLGEIVNVH